MNDIYFLSDRNGEFNIYSYNTVSKNIKQHTFYNDFPVLNISAYQNRILFEQAGSLHVYDRISDTIIDVKLTINTDLLELRQRFVKGNSYIRSAHISPSGVRAVFDYRGDIVTVPADKGDMENLTQTTGVHERFPSWSPNGNKMAYFSDESGEYALHIMNIATSSVKKEKLSGSGFYAYIHWAPDGESLCFVDNRRNFYLYDLKTSGISKIGTNPIYGDRPYIDFFSSWSPDSKWIAYSMNTETNYEIAYLYSINEKKSYAISDGLSMVYNPVFDPSGKYIYMLASTDAGPVVNGFDQSSLDMDMSSSIYVVTLQKDTPNPLAKENDIEKGEKEKDEDENADEKEVKVVIDWEGLSQRIVALPIKPNLYYNLYSTQEGIIYYLVKSDFWDFSSPGKMKKYDLNERKEEEIMEASMFVVSANNKKMLYKDKDKWCITDVGTKPEKENLTTENIKIKIDPQKEWANIFYEAWRVNRDYFYDPGMHGCNWEAMKNKYSTFLSGLSCKSDLYRVMQWMFSELAVGHHRFNSKGDKYQESPKVQGGLLGADFVVDGNRYKISKILGGLNWTPELRSPLTEPGVNIKVGDCIIEVNGKQVYSSDNFYSFFENTAEKIVKLTVSDDIYGNNPRTYKVVPVRSEYELRNMDWVETNLKKVNKATNGQVAYVYVPNTTVKGHQYFKRYFFPQVNKKAIIIDERYNGGGQLADYYIDILKRPYVSSWHCRYGKDFKAPTASIQGPKVLLINEGAGSGGDYFPWMFRKFALGTIVGTTTWGGLVGISGYPEFIDGGIVTAPNLAFWTTEEGFGIENVGVAPDFEVEQWPKDIIEGRDPQLEKAIDIIMKNLEEQTPVERIRPPYPVRIRK